MLTAFVPAGLIPLGDANPAHRTPWMTRLVVAINIVVFVWGQPWAAGACEQQAFFLRWAVVPAELLQGQPLGEAQIDASTSPVCDLAPMAGKSVYAALLYSMFLHAGWLHLAGNMLYLLIFGNNVEDRLGHLGFAGFYLLGGALATIAFVVPNPGSTTTLVGASGAIAAVLGAYLVMFPVARVTVFLPPFFVFSLPARLVLGFWFVVQLSGTRVADMAGGGVAYLAHAAGFVAGIILTLLLGGRSGPSRGSRGSRGRHGRRGPPRRRGRR